MSGLIMVLGYALLSASHDSRAHAAPYQSVMSNGEFVLATGSSTQGVTDMLWVIHKHTPNPNFKRGSAEESKIIQKEMISLSLYRVTKSGERMQFIGTRDIMYDQELTQYANEKPSVKDIVEELAKNLKKE